MAWITKDLELHYINKMTNWKILSLYRLFRDEMKNSLVIQEIKTSWIKRFFGKGSTSYNIYLRIKGFDYEVIGSDLTEDMAYSCLLGFYYGGSPQFNNKIRTLKEEIAKKDNVLHEKNLALDALHHVWCVGGCDAGMNRFDDGKITEEMVKKAEEEVKRMRKWWDNKIFKDRFNRDSEFIEEQRKENGLEDE